MARHLQFSSSSIKLCVTLLLTIFACSMATSYSSCRPKETKMVVYLQDNGPASPYASGVVSAAPDNSTARGYILTTDNRVTEKVSNKSCLVGRGLGIYTIASPDGNDVVAFISFIIEKGVFSGSTLQMQGQHSQLDKVREYAIVGGTKKLRYARGYVILEILYVNNTTFYAVGKSTLTFQYGCTTY
ncbi:OLC1v1031391C1 [Oldenlandia corymbosa var. corymbosa]|uniref:Dirigent protein n=1 Tax=Oldenlandia corymbosa var. corymbosa TaxID=529605 RepID=A0AAV1CJ38_OLDCO|nr:OLC1v1031391C1 [Oldenlandia corymbosa var. corymbosa]